jgi:DNA-binding transcriptional ArsR family regulator
MGEFVEQTKKYPKIIWDIGTAYDFFISLRILHDPTEYGLRPAWASGMRQRLPKRDRDFLENFQAHISISPPFRWIYSLPDPKDSATILKEAKKLSPEERVDALAGLSNDDLDAQEILKEVVSKGSWNEAQLDDLLEIYSSKYGKRKNRQEYKTRFDYLAQAVELSDKLLKALQVYFEVFFEDEERRIFPALKRGLAHAQELAETYELPILLEELSQGVRYQPENFKGVNEVVLAPSFWATPFLFYSSNRPLILVFGARPDDASLVPGEVVPDALMTSLNALADPTRLKILRYLSSDSLTPTQLATRLRLRTPTVLHHIKVLRAAGLVFIIPDEHKKEVHYQTRIERLNVVWEMLNQFVKGQKE